ncbi:Peptidyl-prolyl cis-trans isomerase FKBP53 [Hirschfeldia incana]|nr:Peptidyl-prolyl cis-trans isomerase FKBP53 [Hirschfeldia incana]
MGFWGLEVKPGKPQTYHPKNEQGKLHLTQATLGSGSGKEKSVIQCSVAGNTPIYLCSLLANKTECCPLNLEFEDDDETVEFSVTGDRSIHLTGFLEEYDDEEYEQDEDDSDGMDVAEMGSEESSDYDSEDDEDEDEDEMDEDQMNQFEDFLDRNLEMYRQASVPNSGVVIEEIEDEEKPAEDKKTKRPKKKSQATKEENANKQIVVKESAADVPVLESEDEDGFPLPKENKSGEKVNSDVDEQGSNKKRKAKASEQDGVQESANKNKKKKNQKEKKIEESVSIAIARTDSVLKKKETTQTSSNQKAQNGNSAMSGSSKTPDKSTEKKNKKQKKNSNEEATVEKPSSAPVERNQVKSKAPQEQTYPSGLVVEELKLGKPNGKQATPGKQVLVRYIGKLQKNGKIFDSNIGKAPFKFKLGRGEVIKGWDVGVNGMRVGEKRKLTIPPSMGYGPRGAGREIPPNAWLSFDVELIDVK